MPNNIYYMKNIIMLLGIVLTSCQSEKIVIKVKDEKYIIKVTALKDDINESIIDGFYNGDTTGLSSKIYFIK